MSNSACAGAVSIRSVELDSGRVEVRLTREHRSAGLKSVLFMAIENAIEIPDNDFNKSDNDLLNAWVLLN